MKNQNGIFKRAKFSFLIILGLGLFSCADNSVSQVPIPIPEDSVAFESTSNFVDDFLSLPSDLFPQDYCYDKIAIQDLIEGYPQEFGWDNVKVDSANSFLELENSECYSNITFVSFMRNNKKVAFLSQMSKYGGAFNYLEFNAEQNSWEDKNGLPEINRSDFFENLTDEEKTKVDEYGSFGYYIVDNGKSVECLFYDWQMAMALNADGGQVFEKEADYTIELLWDDEKFWTVKRKDSN